MLEFDFASTVGFDPPFSLLDQVDFASLDDWEDSYRRYGIELGEALGSSLFQMGD
jgi:hypothetical protein